ncbi:MAG TPA: GlsB/YeaQ/YmgE family stress response membrane protein [Candidatus Limnocylindrales bacterium]|jgi:uncharacterized membrane protein YeaQ/YmgE (transglycosylase-associated protein family)|nr:GlsB/YeaQ/YmgE family stress response membrane protein [Candidatus Limnocylindrales bacterium]
MKIIHKAQVFVLALFCAFSALQPQQLSAAEQAGVTQKAEDMAKQTTAAVEKAGSDAAETAKTLWQRIDSARLKNRTADQLVAWVIMGLLAGAFAGMMTKLKPTGMGVFGRLVLGLAGAFLGGIAVAALNVDFGWGPVLIRYEELLFSLVGAVVILVLWRLISSGMKKKEAAH